MSAELKVQFTVSNSAKKKPLNIVKLRVFFN